MIKTLTFTYTKDTGNISERVLVVATEPVDFVSGTDITELDANEQSNYIAEVSEAKELYMEMLLQINEEYDLKHNFRQFKPANMTNVKQL